MAEEGEQADTSEKTPLQCAQEAVNTLYDYRDHYFEKFSISKSHRKDEDVKKKMEECLDFLSSQKDLISSKSQYFMLTGKALNVLPTYQKEAEVLLSKAVKLDPKLVEAWNHLGECYWKNKDISSAKNCFVGALNHSKNKVSLRNLSMVLRQVHGVPPVEKVEIVRESVEKAKDAVHMDITDGSSWANLGNAYLSLFFAEGQNPKTLKQAMSAYSQAVRDPVAKNNPDLHFNRAIAYKHQEEYQEALEGFSTAKTLDCNWLGPVEQEARLLHYLTTVTTLQSTHGKMKAKKLINLSKSIKERDLGPYQGGSYTAENGRTIELKKKTFKELNPGVNKNTVIVGKVVCTVSHSEPIPFVFCFIDEDCSCLSVSLYNIGEGYGVKIGDAVAIPSPFVRDIDVNFKDKVFSYRGVRVDSPVALIVNRRKLGVDILAPMRLAIVNLIE